MDRSAGNRVLRRLAGCIAALAVAVLSSCSESSPADARAGDAEGETSIAGRLSLSGSSTVGPLTSEIARRFESLHPDVRIDVQTGGSSRGIADARKGLVDIGMASRALEPEDGDVIAHTIARDGVGLIVHRDNPLQEITREQVISIYTGEVTNWSAFGGADRSMTVVNKASGRATLDVFLDHFNLTEPAIEADVIVGHNQQGIKTVAGSPGAIGYVSIGAAESEIEDGVAIKLLALDGVEATSANVASGAFPLARPLNLVTRPAPSSLAETFIDYAQSDAVRDLVHDLGYVPVSN